MTGTAKTEEEEFKKIYGLEVLQIPTNKPNQRIDMPDVVYIQSRMIDYKLEASNWLRQRDAVKVQRNAYESSCWAKVSSM